MYWMVRRSSNKRNSATCSRNTGMSGSRTRTREPASRTEARIYRAYFRRQTISPQDLLIIATLSYFSDFRRTRCSTITHSTRSTLNIQCNCYLNLMDHVYSTELLAGAQLTDRSSVLVSETWVPVHLLNLLLFTVRG